MSINSNLVTTNSPPAFLEKLYELLSDESNYADYISWQPDGRSFLIKKPTELSEKVLPKFFKHNNLQSFIRQLNMYCFSKTRHDSNYREFTHKLFQRNRKDLLCYIKRKTQRIVKGNYSDNEVLPIGASSTISDSTDNSTTINSFDLLSSPLDDPSCNDSQVVIELKKRIQSLEMQLWIMNDRYDVLAASHNELCELVENLRRIQTNGNIEDTTSPISRLDSDEFCRIVSTDTVKIKEEPINSMDSPWYHKFKNDSISSSNSLSGEGLSRQHSINGYHTELSHQNSLNLIAKAVEEVSINNNNNNYDLNHNSYDNVDDSSLSAINGLVQVRNNMTNNNDDNQIEAGVSTLIKTLSHSMYLPSNNSELANQPIKRLKSY